MKEVVGSVPGQVIPKTLKGDLVLPWLALGIKRLDQGNMVGLPIVDCKMWPSGTQTHTHTHTCTHNGRKQRETERERENLLNSDGWLMDGWLMDG